MQAREELNKFFVRKNWSGGVCDVVFVKQGPGDTEELDIAAKLPCHAILRRNPGKTLGFATSLRVRSGLETSARVLFEYICDPDVSPWRTCLADSEILRDDAGYPVGLYFKSLERPRNTTAGLCIATRLPWEYGGFLRSFQEWLEKGLEVDKAFFLSTFIHKTEDMYTLQHQGEVLHYPLTLATDPSFKHMKEGIPINGGGFMSDHFGYESVSRLFSSKSSHFYDHMKETVLCLPKTEFSGICGVAWQAKRQFDRNDRTLTCSSFNINNVNWEIAP